MKLLIVDDEEIIRKNLAKREIWRTLGFNEIYTASDGYEALSMISVYNPNIVFTDIKMQNMDGLELLKAIKQKYPWIKCLILSGYNDFEYAKKGMECGACAYILKPTDDQEIKRVFESVLLEISEKEKSLASSINRIGKELGLEIHSFLRDLLQNGQSNDEEAMRTVKRLDIDIQEQCICCVNILLFNAEKMKLNSKDFAVTLINSITSAIKNFDKFMKCEILHEEVYRVTLILSKNNIFQVNEIFKLCKYLKQTIEETLNGIMTGWGIGSIQNCMSDIHKSYKASNSAVKYCFFKGLGSINLFNNANSFFSTKQPLIDITNLEIDLIDFIISKDKIRVISNINSIFSVYSNNGFIEPEFIFNRFIDMLSNLKYRLKEKGINAEEIFIESGGINAATIRENCTIQALKNQVEAFLLKVLENYSKVSFGIMGSIIDYVDKNYMNKITLESAAEVLNLNPSYFSVLFKKETGRNFTDYITEIRIEKAKKMLKRPDIRINEMYEKVGFSDLSYFCKVFRKIEGVSPLEYRSGLIRD